MLILTFKQGKTLVIDKNIYVRVLSVQGGQVRLGIDAPKEVPVDREEIHLRKEAEL